MIFTILFPVGDFLQGEPGVHTISFVDILLNSGLMGFMLMVGCSAAPWITLYVAVVRNSAPSRASVGAAILLSFVLIGGACLAWSYFLMSHLYAMNTIHQWGSVGDIAHDASIALLPPFGAIAIFILCASLASLARKSWTQLMAGLIWLWPFWLARQAIGDLLPISEIGSDFSELQATEQFERAIEMPVGSLSICFLATLLLFWMSRKKSQPPLD